MLLFVDGDLCLSVHGLPLAGMESASIIIGIEKKIVHIDVAMAAVIVMNIGAIRANHFSAIPAAKEQIVRVSRIAI